MTNELKPCPFCGKEPSHAERLTETLYAVVCYCEAQGPAVEQLMEGRDFDNKGYRKASRAWNKRKPPIPVPNSMDNWILCEDEMPPTPKDEDRPVFYLISDGETVSMAELAVDYITGESYFCHSTKYWVTLPNPPFAEKEGEVERLREKLKKPHYVGVDYVGRSDGGI